VIGDVDPATSVASRTVYLQPTLNLKDGGERVGRTHVKASRTAKGVVFVLEMSNVCCVFASPTQEATMVDFRVAPLATNVVWA